MSSDCSGVDTVFPNKKYCKNITIETSRPSWKPCVTLIHKRKQPVILYCIRRLYLIKSMTVGNLPT